jgi:hypothetical protein
VAADTGRVTFPSMFGHLAAFLLGVFLAPAVRPLFRPMMVELVRAGLAIADEVKRATAEVQERVEDAKAEAAATRAPQAPSTPSRRESGDAEPSDRAAP